jgi:hypothetical protein
LRQRHFQLLFIEGPAGFFIGAIVMDEKFKESIAPRGGNGVYFGYVDAIHRKGTERSFEVTDHELELIARHWANEIRSIDDQWDYWRVSGSIETRVKPYAYYRLNKIGEVLGEDQVAQILDDENKKRFMTGVFEVPDDNEHPSTPEAKVYYTTRHRGIVFHHARAGLRPMPGVAEVPGDGWCWQTAEDYKTAKAVEHVGFANSEEALQAAQQAEDAFFKEVDRETEAIWLSLETRQQRVTAQSQGGTATTDKSGSEGVR